MPSIWVKAVFSAETDNWLLSEVGAGFLDHYENQ